MKLLYYYDNPALPDRYTAIATTGEVFAFSKDDSEPEYVMNIIDAYMNESHGYGWEKRIPMFQSSMMKEIIDQELEKEKIISDLGTRIKFHALPEPAKELVRGIKAMEV